MSNNDMISAPQLIFCCFSSSGSTVPIVLQNRPCESDVNTPCTYNRTFTPQGEESFILAATNATMAVFFDVLENVIVQDIVYQKFHLMLARVISIYLCYKEVKIRILN